MSALTIASIAYPCLCLGFCLGLVVSAILRTTPVERRTWRGDR